MNRRAPTQPKNVVELPGAGDFRRLFAQSSVRHNFHLTLTSPMLEMLCAIADGCVRDREYHWTFGNVTPHNFVTAAEPLIKRGLVYHVPRELQPDDAHKRRMAEGSIAGVYNLTPIGEAFVALLKVAGLFVKCDAAIARDAREETKNR